MIPRAADGVDAAKRLAARSDATLAMAKRTRSAAKRAVNLSQTVIAAVNVAGTTTVSADFVDVRLGVYAGDGIWVLRHGLRSYELSASDRTELLSVLPVEVLDGFGAVSLDGSAGLGRIDGALAARLTGSGEERVVALSTNAVDLVAPVTVNPQPWHDRWVPTAFKVVVENVSHLEIEALVPAADLPGKDYVVSHRREIVSQGTLERGRRTPIVIDRDLSDEIATFDVHLAFPEPARPGEMRRLGAVLLGTVRKVSNRRLAR